MSYICFLRGISVGGRTVVKMDPLRHAFEGLGFENVETVFMDLVMRMLTANP